MTMINELTAPWRHRHLLGLEPLSADELTAILDRAESFAECSQPPRRKLHHLEGRTRMATRGAQP